MARKKTTDTESQETQPEETQDEGGKVQVPEDVLQDTGATAGELDPPAKESLEAAEAAEDPEGKMAPVDGPFANAAVAGATRQRTFAQKAQLYTDGLSGQADSNMDRAYGDELATAEENNES
jgi:hypothetical protein